MWEFRVNFNRTHSREATGNNGHRKLKKTLRSNVKTKLDPFGNVANLFDKLFSKSEFYLLNKNHNFFSRLAFLGLTNIIIKTSTKAFLSFTVINLGHTLDQLKMIQINLDLKVIAIDYHINYLLAMKITTFSLCFLKVQIRSQKMSYFYLLFFLSHPNFLTCFCRRESLEYN